MRTNRWVVTYDCQYADRRHLSAWYEGSERECRRIALAFTTGGDDRVPTCDWRVMIGPVREWEMFMREMGNGP